jgi:hypothetical protein
MIGCIDEVGAHYNDGEHAGQIEASNPRNHSSPSVVLGLATNFRQAL